MAQRTRSLSRGIRCDYCGDSVEHNGPQFRMIENENGDTLAYICDTDCEDNWLRKNEK